MNLTMLCTFEYRCLEDDFILVQARLVVPCSYVSRKVPYKYIVLKEKRKDSKEKAKYLWEYLVGWGYDKNRCLQIPKERCGQGGDYCFCCCLHCHASLRGGRSKGEGKRGFLARNSLPLPLSNACHAGYYHLCKISSPLRRHEVTGRHFLGTIAGMI